MPSSWRKPAVCVRLQWSQLGKRQRRGKQDCQINVKWIAEGVGRLEEHEGAGESGLRAWSTEIRTTSLVSVLVSKKPTQPWPKPKSRSLEPKFCLRVWAFGPSALNTSFQFSVMKKKEGPMQGPGLPLNPTDPCCFPASQWPTNSVVILVQVFAKAFPACHLQSVLNQQQNAHHLGEQKQKTQFSGLGPNSYQQICFQGACSGCHPMSLQVRQSWRGWNSVQGNIEAKVISLWMVWV